MTRTLSVFLFSCAMAFAQMSTSQINGTVRDITGAVIPGAHVTATNEATGVNYTQTTTGSGLYAFPAVPVGVYSISVEMAGFKTSRKTGNILSVDTPLTVDMSLEVGTAARL